jgi:hypothetical protein
VTIGRAARRAERLPRVEASFGAATQAALDLLELTELAWHDCYAELTPSEEIIDEILLCSEGEPGLLVQACRLAVEDRRDSRCGPRRSGSGRRSSERRRRTQHGADHLIDRLAGWVRCPVQSIEPAT